MARNLKRLLATLPNRDGDDDGPNPGAARGYCGWGPHEDYLAVRDGEGGQWNTRLLYASSEEFLVKFVANDPDLNLVADFYFAVAHDATECICGGTGYNTATRALADDFYDMAGTGRRWCDQITQDELRALRKSGRQAGEMPLDQVNQANRPGTGLLFGEGRHDGINRFILIKARGKRLGVYGLCVGCQGEGMRRTSEDYLVLNVWLLHPRKGASRALEIKRVDPAHLPKLRAWLKSSWKVHQRHFRWVAVGDYKRRGKRKEAA